MRNLYLMMLHSWEIPQNSSQPNSLINRVYTLREREREREREHFLFLMVNVLSSFFFFFDNLMVNVLSSKGMGPVVYIKIIPLLNGVTPKTLLQCTFWSNTYNWPAIHVDRLHQIISKYKSLEHWPTRFFQPL